MIDESKHEELKRDIAAVLNKHSVDTDLATPDFLIAEYVVTNLQAYATLLYKRAAWFGKIPDQALLAANKNEQ